SVKKTSSKNKENRVDEHKHTETHNEENRKESSTDVHSKERIRTGEHEGYTENSGIQEQTHTDVDQNKDQNFESKTNKADENDQKQLGREQEHMNDVREEGTRNQGTEKEMTPQGASRSQEGGHGSSGNKEDGNQSKISTIPVVFHVVVSPDFKLNRQTDRLGISFEPRKLGGWENWHEMTIAKSSKDGYFIGEAEIEIPQLLLSQCQKIPYKYQMVLQGEKSVWEEIPKTVFRGKHVNRMFYISSHKLKQIDKWHQYDGIMHKRPDDFKLKGWWKKHVTGSYHKKCLEHDWLL
ncbi:hypothetical protein LSH36_24g12100, partial [Paralvinella palmiformis]